MDGRWQLTEEYEFNVYPQALAFDSGAYWADDGAGFVGSTSDPAGILGDGSDSTYVEMKNESDEFLSDFFLKCGVPPLPDGDIVSVGYRIRMSFEGSSDANLYAGGRFWPWRTFGPLRVPSTAYITDMFVGPDTGLYDHPMTLDGTIYTFDSSVDTLFGVAEVNNERTFRLSGVDHYFPNFQSRADSFILSVNAPYGDVTTFRLYELVFTATYEEIVEPSPVVGGGGWMVC